MHNQIPNIHPQAPAAAMSVDGATRYLSIGRTKIYAEIAAGRLSARKIGNKTLIRKVDADAWLDALPSLGGAA